MKEMTTHERMQRMYEHRDADCAPVTDSPWGSTVERWRREGLPQDASVEDYFALDKFAWIFADNSPRYPVKVIEETGEFVIRTTAWGQTIRSWKKHGGVPEFLHCRITTPEAWAQAKAYCSFEGSNRLGISEKKLFHLAKTRALDPGGFLVWL
ncbi:MAG: hypothetical protein PHV34_12870 [Verrucomicrobiae bacterium]|nr:hypothetical protein [Verrucomicrobiae bacterium]